MQSNSRILGSRKELCHKAGSLFHQAPTSDSLMAMGTRRSAPFRHTTFSAVETCVLAQRLVELIKGHKDFRKSSTPFSVKSSDHSFCTKNLLKLNICHRFRNTANENSGISNFFLKCGSALDSDAI